MVETFEKIALVAIIGSSLLLGSGCAGAGKTSSRRAAPPPPPPTMTAPESAGVQLDKQAPMAASPFPTGEHPYIKRIPGRAFLPKQAQEPQGYGLYSYVVWASSPTPQSRERYIAVIKAFLDIQRMEDVQLPGESQPEAHENIIYLPVRELPNEDQANNPEWVLDNFDKARAQVILRAIPGNHGDGPYLISSRVPLSSTNYELTDNYLVQNLSAVPPRIASLWVSRFVEQTKKEKFYKTDIGEAFTRRSRTIIAQVADIPDLRGYLAAVLTLGQ